MSLPKKTILPEETVFKMLESSIKKAKELGIKISVAGVDDGGNLSGFIKMTGAKLMPSQIAQNKAFTAAGFGLPTSEWYPKIKDNPPLLHGIVNTERMTIFAGGLPIYQNDDLVGGIGVSGGTSEQDEECAEAALQVLKNV